MTKAECSDSAKISQCALDNPDLPIEFIQELLIIKDMDRALAKPFEFKDGDE